MAYTKSALLSVLAAASTNALSTSPLLGYNGCTYQLPSIGSFTDSIVQTFTSLSDLNNNFTISTATIEPNYKGDGVIPRTFQVKNVQYSTADSALQLLVPGNQQTGVVYAAEIQTAAKDILYASVRTIAKTSAVSGTTHGFSFYHNDTQEADIAYVTYNDAFIHFTNEQNSIGSGASSFAVAAPSDAATAFHEYRMDWIPGATQFYIDGILVYTINVNVPTTAGFLLWNNWSNGDAWAKGPPQSDNILEIKSISTYFNRTSTAVDSTSSVCKAAARTFANGKSCAGIGASTYTDGAGTSYNLKCGYDLPSAPTLATLAATSFESCFGMCSAYSGCGGFSFSSNTCILKNLNGVTTAPTAAGTSDFAYVQGKLGFLTATTTTMVTTTSAAAVKNYQYTCCGGIYCQVYCQQPNIYDCTSVQACGATATCKPATGIVGASTCSTAAVATTTK